MHISNTQKERFKVRNVGGWQRLQNQCDDLKISNEALIKEFAGGLNAGDATQDKYAQLLYEFAEWLAVTYDETPLMAAKGKHVERFIHTYLKTNGRAQLDAERDQPCGWKGALSPSSRKAYLAALRELWRYCGRVEYTDRDPTLGIETPRLTHEPGLTLTEDEIRKFLDAPGRERDRVQAHLLVYTAARSSSLRMLRWEDIDFRSKQILIRSKGGKVTQIPMHHELYSALRRWQDKQLQQAETIRQSRRRSLTRRRPTCS